LPRLSGDYPDSLRILSADRSIIREAYPAYPPQVCTYDPTPPKFLSKITAILQLWTL
jgi:hypothetical protein